MGETPFHNVSFIFNYAQPGRFQPSTRSTAGYTQIMDNERARGWRLVLEPGQTADAITQTGPRPARRARWRRDRRTGAKPARSRHDLAARRVLLAGRGRDARRPQYRHDAAGAG